MINVISVYNIVIKLYLILFIIAIIIQKIIQMSENIKRVEVKLNNETVSIQNHTQKNF